MKTLKDHLILFDAECPMCGLYTKAFVSGGLLETDGRVSYQEYPARSCPNLDWERAVNEIALVNQKTGEVTYGVESLFKIIATAVPFLKPLFQYAPFIWLMSRFYAFISYNRRVIIPAPVSSQSFHFQPVLKKHYRIAYLIFTWVATSFILFNYGKLLSGILPAAPMHREYLICGGQIVFQALVIWFYKKEKNWEYLGNLMTISFAGALLLFPVLLINSWAGLSAGFCFVWFALVVSLMFMEHIRRSKLLGLGYLMTFTWVFYRVVILLIIYLT